VANVSMLRSGGEDNNAIWNSAGDSKVKSITCGLHGRGLKSCKYSPSFQLKNFFRPFQVYEQFSSSTKSYPVSLTLSAEW
jgi:hypothetical protein